MSLINQMLKDLDKRGGEVAAGNTARGTIRAVSENGKKSSPLLWVVLLLLVALGAVVAWLRWDAPTLPPIQAAAPVSATASVPAVPVVPPPSVDAPPVAAPAVASTPALPAAAVSKPPEDKKSQPPVKADKPVATPAPATEGAMKLALSGTLASIAAPEPKAAPAVRGKRAANTNSAAAEPARMSKETTPQQQADNAYGRAVTLLESGRKAEAISALESVLAQNSRHGAARQTLVGLLLDAKRSDDAVRVLKDGLQIDSSQTGMAMILARLQVEKGDTTGAISTLRHSLPHATHKPDYQAFLAALFQREKRHREAIGFYRLALRDAPNNGIWWMGYGISLQADGRLADARTAFAHARDTGRLSPALRAFVEQRISELPQ